MPLGRWIQLDCSGFLPNERQFRQFGLAVTEIAQVVKDHWGRIRRGEEGLSLPNQSSSRSTGKHQPSQSQSPSASEPAGGSHPMECRDVFDIAVRWRQISEPNDPVWWIDELAPEAFAEGFGLQTPLVNGQLKVYRYYSYFHQAFSLMKDLMVVVGEFGEPEASELRSVATLHRLYELWEQGDFWVVSPCVSTAVNGRTMEGTRLTVVFPPPSSLALALSGSIGVCAISHLARPWPVGRCKRGLQMAMSSASARRVPLSGGSSTRKNCSGTGRLSLASSLNRRATATWISTRRVISSAASFSTGSTSARFHGAPRLAVTPSCSPCSSPWT